MVRAAKIPVLIAFLYSAIALRAQETTPTAKFYFYRASMLQGMAIRPAVYCDGKKVIRMQSGHVFEMDVPPGEHSCYMGDRKSGAVVQTEAGKDYYFRVVIQPGVLKGVYRLNMVMPEEGKFDIQRLKPSKPSDVSDSEN